jgi:uncharacterized protein YciI
MGCAAPSSQEGESTLSWVWILTGPRDGELQGDARQAAFSGHFANIQRLAEEGKLLLAGPFADPRTDARHRGIFVLATGDEREAREWAQTDPTAQAGVFELAIATFRTRDPLKRVHPRHEAAVAAAGGADLPFDFHARPYVLVGGLPARAAARALPADAEGVLFAGLLASGSNEEWIVCLDAVTAEAAREKLRALPAGGVEWRVMPWFASAEVAGLRD